MTQEKTPEQEFDSSFDDALKNLDVEGHDPDKLPKGASKPAASTEDPAPEGAAADSSEAGASDETPAAGDTDPAPAADAGDPQSEGDPAAAAPAAGTKNKAGSGKPAASGDTDPAPVVEQENEEYTLPEFALTEAEKAARKAWEEDGEPMTKVAFDSYIRETEHRVQNQMITGLANTLSLIDKQVKPIAESNRQRDFKEHMTALKGAVPKLDEIKPKLQAWIKTQPPALREAYQGVYDGGSVEDVVGLVGTFERATGQAPAPSKERTDAPAKETAPPARNSRAESMVSVRTERTKPSDQATDDPNDFDGAFADAINADE